jgi:copper(I)-binding protein
MKLHPIAVAALAVTMAAPIGLPLLAPALAASTTMSMSPAAKTWMVGDLTVSAPYARATLPNAPVGGGYITITNNGKIDDTLVSAKSAALGEVQLHDMKMNGSVMEMRDLPNGVPIPAGQTVVFSPNGLHLMFMHPGHAFIKGKAVPVTLTFVKAGSVTVDLAVGGIAASAPPGAKADDSMAGMKM